MRRREFIKLLGGATVVCPFAGPVAQAARAEGAVAVIGLLSPFTRAATEQWRQALTQGLRELGWVVGANARIEDRYADGQVDRLTELASELVKLRVDVIVVTITPDALAAARATKTIPIVMASAGDPLGTGLIASLARPGGNITGLTQISTDLAGKRLELLKEVAPGVSRVAVLWNPQDASSRRSWQEIQLPARRLGMELHSLEVQSGNQLDAAFASANGANDGAIAALPGPIFLANGKSIVAYAAANRLPSIFHLPEFVHAGGLLSYGPDRADLFRRAATYVDKILKGADPSQLPVEQPTKFNLVINLKTAEAIGVVVPPQLIARADELIE